MKPRRPRKSRGHLLFVGPFEFIERGSEVYRALTASPFSDVLNGVRPSSWAGSLYEFLRAQEAGRRAASKLPASNFATFDTDLLDPSWVDALNGATYWRIPFVAAFRARIAERRAADEK